jgi:hypothetical protein
LITKAKALSSLGRSRRSASRGAFGPDLSLRADGSGAPLLRQDRSGLRTRLALLLTLTTTAALIALTAVPALAATTRSPIAAFGPDGTSGSSFDTPNALAFDQSSSRLYALAQGTASVYGLDASTPGTYTPLAGSFPLAVDATVGYVDDLAADPASHNLYFLSEADAALYGFDSTGAPLGGNFPVAGFSDPCGAAVDPSGNVWVGDYGAGAVIEYDSAGNPTGTTVDTSAQEGGSGPCHIAFDSSGDLYVAFYFDATWRYTAASGYSSATEIDSSSTNALAVDRSTDTVYVAHTNHVSAYDASGAHLYDFGATISGADYEGIAVNEATDEFYASDAGNAKLQVFGPARVIPDVTTNPATAVGGTTATLNGTVNPDGVQLSDCHFDVGTDTNYTLPPVPCDTADGNPISGPGDIPADSSDHAVSADLTGLDPETTYHFRLVAANANGTTAGSGQTFTTPPAVLGLATGTATAITDTTATLNGTLNPNGLAITDCHFDYGATAAYGQIAPCVPASPSGSDPVAVSADLTGLDPQTTYHFRLQATDAVGTTTGADQSFSAASCPNTDIRDAQGSTFLPDCRAYEQVSPADKLDGELTPIGGIRAATGGDGLAYPVLLPLADGQQGGQDTVLSTRSSSDWTSESLNPPQATATVAIQSPSVPWLSSDLSKFLLHDGGFAHGQDDPPLVPGEPQGVQNLFFHDNATGTWQLLSPTPLSGDPENASFLAASPDGGTVVFASEARLTPDAVAGVSNLYQWSAATSQLSLVSVATDGTPMANGATAGQGGSCVTSHLACGVTINSVSQDGTRVFFTETRGGGQTPGQLFVRLNGATTVEASASQRSTPDPNGGLPPSYWPASADGSTAFFTSCVKLTDDSTADSTNTSGNACVSGQDLYAYDVASGVLSDLSVDSNSDPQGADVQGVVGTGGPDDDPYVYFVANGVLAPGATPGDCAVGGLGQSPEGECSLYLRHDGETTFIARLSGWDLGDWGIGGQARSSDQGDVSGHTSRLTPDGAHLAFESIRPLTGFDNTVSQGSSCGTFTNGAPRPAACTEVFLYDAGTGEIRCASCNPSGATPAGRSTIGGVLGAGFGFYLPRNLSDDGSRLFFSSSDAVLPGDSNGRQDVYESAADQIRPISTGTGDSPSSFFDATPTGDDVFFLTRQRLVGQDGDDARDVYDARVGGGLASQNPPPATPCQGDACQGAPAPPPGEPGSGSSGFSGAGNQGRDRTPTAAHKKRCKGIHDKRKRRKCLKKHNRHHRQATHKAR